MTYAEFFLELKGKFQGVDVSHITEHLAYQFNIIGEAEGIFYIEVKDGQLYMEPYEYFDRDVIFTCSKDTLLKIAAGKLDPVVAFTEKELGVEGDFDKALKLQNIVQ